MTYTESDTESATLHLIGVWIRDPDLDGGDSRNFPYGSAQRRTGLDLEAEALHYVGRADPVVEYGEHRTRTVSIALDVPHGSTWTTDLEDLRAFAESRKPLHIRDNRGRSVCGPLSGYQEEDQEWGTKVSFTVTQVDRTVDTVA